MKKFFWIPTIAAVIATPLSISTSCGSKKPENKFLTFTATDDCEFYVDSRAWRIETRDTNLFYSIDSGKTWTEYVMPSTSGEGAHINIGAGCEIQFYGNNQNGFNYEDKKTSFTFIMHFENKNGSRCGKISGNIMSLLSYNYENLTSIPCSGCFSTLFAYSAISDASDLVLPATHLTPECYYCMFQDCPYLTTPPTTLPAMELEEDCYNSMFSYCGSLTQTPKLPATMLAECCYVDMFRNCESLEINSRWFVNNIFNKPNMSFAPGWAGYMFSACPSITEPFVLPDSTYNLKPYCFSGLNSGLSITSVSKNYLPWNNLAEGCYDGMFCECASLTSTPELPATQLVNYCYSGMFIGCYSLKIRQQETKTGDEGFIFTCPSQSDLDGPVEYMFVDTDSSFTNDPVTGFSYYWYTE